MESQVLAQKTIVLYQHWPSKLEMLCFQTKSAYNKKDSVILHKGNGNVTKNPIESYLSPCITEIDNSKYYVLYYINSILYAYFTIQTYSVN